MDLGRTPSTAAHDQGLDQVRYVFLRDPLPGADLRVPGPGPHVRQVDRVDPVCHPARPPHVLPFHCGSGNAGLFLPVSSIAPITIPPRRRLRRAAASRSAATNRRTWLIAANVSQAARLSSRCVRSGVRSAACWEIVHPFRLDSSLSSADTYFPACSYVCVRTKHDSSSSSSPARFRPPTPGPYPGSSSRLRFCCPRT